MCKNNGLIWRSIYMFYLKIELCFHCNRYVSLLAAWSLLKKIHHFVTFFLWLWDKVALWSRSFFSTLISGSWYIPIKIDNSKSPTVNHLMIIIYWCIPVVNHLLIIQLFDRWCMVIWFHGCLWSRQVSKNCDRMDSTSRHLNKLSLTRKSILELCVGIWEGDVSEKTTWLERKNMMQRT